MGPRAEILVIIPTYNEAGNIVRLIREIHAQGLGADLLVVDDNSPDGTASLAEGLSQEAPVSVLRREGKLGLGSAHKAGFRYALQRGYPMVITIDGDFAHPPHYLQQMVNRAAEADVVVGSRFLSGADFYKIGWLRPLISWTTHFLARVLLRLPYDCTGGLRLYRLTALRSIDLAELPSDGHALLFEILHAFKRKGFRIAEIPIIVEGRPAGKSKVTWVELLRSGGAFGRLILRSWVCPNK